MGEVVGFNQKPGDRDYFSSAADALRARYRKAGIPSDVITEALVEYRPIHERLFSIEASAITLPAGLTDDQAEAIIESVRAAVIPQLGYASRVIFELMFRQILEERERG